MKGTDPAEGEEVQGVLVTHNFTTKIVEPKDLATYTPLRTGSITSKLHVPFAGSIETLRLFITEMFSGVTEDQIAQEGKSCTKFSLHQDKVSSLMQQCYTSMLQTLNQLTKLLYDTGDGTPGKE